VASDHVFVSLSQDMSVLMPLASHDCSDDKTRNRETDPFEETPPIHGWLP
jgi:hypothetical protein